MPAVREELTEPRTQLSDLLKAWRTHAGLSAATVDGRLHAGGLIDTATSKFTSQMEHGKGRLTRGRCDRLAQLYERDADTLWRYWLRASVAPDTLAFFEQEIEKAQGGGDITASERALIRVSRALADRHGVDITKSFFAFLSSAITNAPQQSKRMGPVDEFATFLNGYNRLPLHVQRHALSQMAGTIKTLHAVLGTSRTTPFLKEE